METIKEEPVTNESKKKMLELKKIEKEIKDNMKKLKPKRTHIVWPRSTADGPLRNRKDILEIIEKIENEQEMTADEAKGIVGRSILFDLPGFDFIMGITVDYLHCVCLGVVKKCVELTFAVGDTRSRVTKRPLSAPSLFNVQIILIKCPHEFNRRIRELDFAVYKGQEFRNLLLFFFPLVLNCIEEKAKERQMWLYLTFVIKACVIPTEEFRPHSIEDIDDYCKKFYVIYETLFGSINCTYNTHVMSSHLIEMRHSGPLTSTSAFPFESFYGEVRNSFVPGTNNTLKQIMSNIMMKRVISHHCCERDIYISEKDTALECNSMIYTFSDLQYTFYKVQNVNGDELLCVEIEKLACSFPDVKMNWSIVGVFKKGRVLSENVTISRKNVKGKVLELNEFLISCPTNILREK